MGGRAHYGLPLKSHPVQDVIPKREPINYIRNTLYPKAGSRFLLLPRQYALVPHNNGVYWGAWRYGHSRAQIYFAALVHSLVTCGLPTLPMAVNSTNHGEEAILSCTVPLVRIFMMNML